MCTKVCRGGGGKAKVRWLYMLAPASKKPGTGLARGTQLHAGFLLISTRDESFRQAARSPVRWCTRGCWRGPPPRRAPLHSAPPRPPWGSPLPSGGGSCSQSPPARGRRPRGSPAGAEREGPLFLVAKRINTTLGVTPLGAWDDALHELVEHRDREGCVTVVRAPDHPLGDQRTARRCKRRDFG